ncbi:Ig-like domain-containing protein [Pseudomonas sp. SCB32]|uniref:Ig-like domain-containing protein n=1 Tax=Pseudomonas sp. SCB32 TaxID=2653853 RepID=UPI0012659D42|nr:Ig-like domain-containing protein [Pseudomonas sp. SCB32]
MNKAIGNNRNISSAPDLLNDGQVEVYPAYVVPSMPVEVTNLYGSNYSIGTMTTVSSTVSTGELSTSYASPLSTTPQSSYASRGLLGNGLLKATTAPAMTFAATDHAGPVTGELASGATTDDIRPVFHGTATPNTLVSIVAEMIGADGKPVAGGSFEVGKALVQQNGTWEFTPYAPLKDGAYDFHISQGQESSAAFRLTIDRAWTDGTEPTDQPQQPEQPVPEQPTQPEQPQQPEQPEQPTSKAMTFAATDHAGPVTGELASGATTDDIRPVFHGTATPNTLVSIVAEMIGADGKPVAGGSFEVGKALVQQNGTWEFTPYAPLKDGAYDFHISQGQESSAAFRLTIDRAWTDDVSTSKGSFLPSHGMELDLSGLSASSHDDSSSVQSASAGKASLPSLSNVLEIATHELPLAGNGFATNANASVSSVSYYAPADFHPVKLDELTVQHVVV